MILQFNVVSVSVYTLIAQIRHLFIHLPTQAPILSSVNHSYKEIRCSLPFTYESKGGTCPSDSGLFSAPSHSLKYYFLCLIYLAFSYIIYPRFRERKKNVSFRFLFCFYRQYFPAVSFLILTEIL